jgi:hypothetical protein
VDGFEPVFAIIRVSPNKEEMDAKPIGADCNMKVVEQRYPPWQTGCRGASIVQSEMNCGVSAFGAPPQGPRSAHLVLACVATAGELPLFLGIFQHISRPLDPPKVFVESVPSTRLKSRGTSPTQTTELQTLVLIRAIYPRLCIGHRTTT